MEVFTEDFISKLPPVRKVGNPFIVALSRYDNDHIKKLRSSIEEWLDNFSPEDAKEIVARLKKLDNNQSLAAFYEIIIKEWFTQNDYSVERVSLNGGKPDYMISGNGISFILEITTLFQDADTARKEIEFHQLLNKLDTIRSNVFLSVHISDWLKEVNNNRVLKFVKEKVEVFNKNNSEKEKYIYTDENNKIEFDLYRASKVVNIIGSWMGPIRSGDSCNRIREKMAEKVKKYPSVKGEIPFVIAICHGGDFMLDQISIEDALFGRLQVIFNVGPTEIKNDEVKTVRDRSGFITPTFALLSGSNTRVTGVLYVKWGNEGEKTFIELKYFENPWTKQALEHIKLVDMPMLTLDTEDSGGVTLSWKKKESKKHYLN